MSTKKRGKSVKSLHIFIFIFLALFIFFKYLSYERSIYERLQVFYEKNESIFHHIKDICNMQMLERGETAAFIKNGDTWLFKTSVNGMEESEMFKDANYMEWINRLDRQIRLKEVFIACDELRFVLDVPNKRYAEIRYMEEKLFFHKVKFDEMAELESNWFLLGLYYSYESRLIEEDKMEYRKKVFKENIDLFNEYISLAKKLDIMESSLRYDSVSEGINFEDINEGYEIERFDALTDELKELIEFQIVSIYYSEMEFRFDGEAYSPAIKYTENPNFNTKYMSGDHIEETLDPNWYYTVNFHYNPLEGKTWMDLFLDDSVR